MRKLNLKDLFKHAPDTEPWVVDVRDDGAPCWATTQALITRRPGAVVYEIALGDRAVDSVGLERRGHTLAVTVHLRHSPADLPLRRCIPLPVDLPTAEPTHQIERGVLTIEFAFPTDKCDGQMPEFAGWVSRDKTAPDDKPEPCKEARNLMRSAIAAAQGPDVSEVLALVD